MTEIAVHLKSFAGFGRRIDRVWLAVLAIFTALAVAAAAQAEASALFVLGALTEMAPFLALAVGVAAYARASNADSLIASAFQGRLTAMIFFAALFGGLAPFCSCGVIPLIAALLSMGVPVPAVMAFWLASPLMDPSMFVLTAGTLGLDFAVAKTIAAVGIGLMGGFATAAVQSRGVFADPLRPSVGNGGCGGAKARAPSAVVWKFWGEEERRRKFYKESGSTALFLLKWLTLAFLLESLMLSYVSAEQIAALLGAGNDWAIPLAALVGVPAYFNGYAALPLVSGMIEMGIAPGAGMAFLVAGGVTSVPAAIAVYALVRKPVFGWYLGLSLGGGLLSGVLFQLYAS